jgi:DNA polymerase V
MEQWIGLLDCNNFFVSCERLFRPDLVRKPVLVLSSNDGCVVARSQEIKDKGVSMGVPYFQVKDIIKDSNATMFSSHFALYRDISRRVFEVMRAELDTIEQYSVDEAFFNLEGNDISILESRLHELKDKVERVVGIPVSLGLAKSKTLAKYAGSVAKRTNGVFILSSNEWGSRVSTVKLGELWGVGLRLTVAYKNKGIITATDLIRLEQRQVQELFGVVGVRLWQELQGIASIALKRQLQTQKSILSSRSFKATSSDKSVLQDAVAYHVREAAADLRAMKQKTTSIQVHLGTSRHGDYLLQGGTLAATLPNPTNDTFVLLKAASQLVEKLFKDSVPYKKAGVLLTNFSPELVNQLELFVDTQEDKTKGLMPVIDSINHGMGRNSLLLGSHLQTKKWQSSQESRSPAYTTSWKDIAIVKAQ